MRRVVTGEQMRAIDRFTIQEIQIPSLVLMERAALAVAEEVKKRAGKKARILCACGCGNNGADGVAVARMLFLAGYSAEVVFVGDRKKSSQEFERQVLIAEKLGIAVRSSGTWEPKSADVLVDGIFGVGLSRPVEGMYREFMEQLEQLDFKLTAAVDIPSGISSDNGQVLGKALRADVTVTFGWEKLGTVLFPGRAYAGQVVTADIGFPEYAFVQAERLWTKPPLCAFTLDPEDLEQQRPLRPPYSNKGTFGKVLLVAGSRDMCGAAYLSALAAYRTGAGLVKILTAEEGRAPLQARLPEAVLETYPSALLPEDVLRYQERLRRDCEWADVVVLGPGLGQAPYAKTLVELVLAEVCSPLIVDADALNILAADPRLTGYFTENIIITPHLGEMARLTGKTIAEIQKDLIGTAREYGARYGITCVLKDAATVAALRDGRVYLNTSGNSVMAKAGSGDVLTGVMAGLLAQGMEEMDGVVLAVYLHGAAGDRYREENGAYGMLAGELADYAGKVLQGSPQARRAVEER